MPSCGEWKFWDRVVDEEIGPDGECRINPGSKSALDPSCHEFEEDDREMMIVLRGIN